MKKHSKPAAVDNCPCGQPLPYTSCCGRFHRGELPATAEQLMRSRYCAYVLADESYLLTSWASSTRPQTLDLAADAAVKWLGLQVQQTTAGQAADQTGTVRFVARYKLAGRAYRLQENSRFIREDGAWRYLDGDVDEG
ncbi:YchJ family protein [Vogesella oryzae]|uniref:YchJ family protein n=1 Tax=Vogesella oryzae TaxID=1735285 RepID=UPI00158441DC|nr:YchJ family metal-binding protein [Vogesella oryzae]